MNAMKKRKSRAGWRAWVDFIGDVMFKRGLIGKCGIDRGTGVNHAYI